MILWLATAGLLAASPAPASPPQGAEARPFVFRVPALSGGTLAAEDFKGRILVVDVWATWCGPCQIVIPHLNDLHERYKSRGVSVVGISADEKDGVADGYNRVRRFVAEHRMAYPVGLMNEEAYGAVMRVLGTNPGEGFAVPATIVLGPDGGVLRTYEGYYRGQEADLESLVARLVKPEPAADTNP